MRYVSTRGMVEPFDFAHDRPKGFSEILLEGLAPDGGLYVPEEYPQVSQDELNRMRKMAYPELAFAILSKFIDDIPSADLKRMVEATYTEETFGSTDIVPIKKLEANLYLLDLCQGPTLAFKDIALQLLGRLFEQTLAKEDRQLNILGATSGDTGSAAEYSMRGRRGIRVFMLSPLDRMSDFQRKQMYTLQDKNIFNIAIRGTFDDCQDIVKAVNEDAEFKKMYKLGAVNSINWARIAAQIVYYFWGYFGSTKLTTSRATNSNEEQVSFAVPTGNFGNILAGYIAKQMGLPVRHLILATNENNVLEEFFRTGTYRPRKGSEVAATSSPSMDISKASNFERYIFDVVERDPKRMTELWQGLKEKGSFAITSSEFGRVKASGFVAGSSTHTDRVATIRAIYEKYHVLIDPHTADGVTTGLSYREKSASRRIPLVCLETAQPAKFAATIHEAIGRNPELPNDFKKLTDLPERFEVLDANPQAIKEFIAAA
ncbi:threonine synthase [Candidatus Kaiserbacteria bacterium RIFCSPLOWO2_01_FULL_54_13]|uniref:Threonine synthase n=1 Tax=Candidatus Kaiserbacteria bacterium RIFCSPLOWO2_01_FULL_54_13 TaxID=1798512 RepID=A0A1F6F1V6_9BACT|nr:MAG: threonine synthase [Candidatus Kaiserbacteria bacterium RIFCSPLOWO2_01_FULL_54_13]